MAAASWKGSIKFGPLVQFPVRAKAVDREVKFPYNQHHAADGGRIRSAPGICELCAEPVDKTDIVKGYKGVPGVDTEYLESLELQRSSVMELDGLVPASKIEPRQFHRSYDLVAETGGEKTYVLFMRLMEDAGLVALGKIVTGGQEHLVVVRPRDGALEMELLWWPEEIKSDAEARAAIDGVEVTDAEMSLGRKLVEMMARDDLDLATYKNEYASAVGAYLESFVAGKEPVRLDTRPIQAAPAMSLEDALAASLGALATVPAKKAARKEKVA